MAQLLVKRLNVQCWLQMQSFRYTEVGQVKSLIGNYRRRLEVCDRQPFSADRTAIGSGVCDRCTDWTGIVGVTVGKAAG